MARKKPVRSAALQYAYERYVGDDSERQGAYEQELLNAEIASLLFRLRTEAGLSQRELAKRVGTTASVICRLEDADYEGHSLGMLNRIATALNKRVDIRLLTVKRAPQRA